MLSQLSPQEQDLLIRRYGLGLDEPEPRKEMAQRYRVKEDRLKYLHKLAVGKLRKNPHLQQLVEAEDSI